ncbi:MAG TPA: UDP-glucose 6-dehydrogenase [Actinobacteria bacterium]|nr:UDP-glucose 6-dehydrogenase [Actinomycetota bacterium]
MEVAVIGAGYVGLVTAAGLARLGHTVRLAESDELRLAMLTKGESPIYEPGLQELLSEVIQSGALSLFSSNLDAVRGAAVVVIAVPTPQSASGAADTTIVEQVVSDIAPHLDLGAVIALKSTTPTDSFTRLQETLDHHSKGGHLVINPEFLREGAAVADFLKPDRIVLGVASDGAVERMTSLYADLGAPLVVTDPVSAGIIKYAANAFLATRISFANAIANVCEAVGANVRDVLLGMGFDRRIGFHFLDPGPGFGGSCLPKDTQALVALADEGGYDFALLRGVIDVNQQQMARVLSKVRRALNGSVAGRTVGVWGLAFKAGTDDVRESPAVWVAKELANEGAVVLAYDPRARVVDDGITQVGSALDAVRDADALVILTEWDEFQTVSLGELRTTMRGRVVVDARNLLDPEAVRRHGFTYLGVGR